MALIGNHVILKYNVVTSKPPATSIEKKDHCVNNPDVSF